MPIYINVHPPMNDTVLANLMWEGTWNFALSNELLGLDLSLKIFSIHISTSPCDDRWI